MISFALLILIPLSAELAPTTLVPPPFGHTMGYTRATPFELRLIFGKSISFQEPQRIICCKLKALDDPETSKDDDELTVYCTNSWANQIVYNKSLKEVSAYGSFGSSYGEFWWPQGITANPDGDIYVADVENHRVVYLKNELDSLKWMDEIGGFGCDTSEFDNPWDVTLDSKSQIWVVDRGNNRIQVFAPNGGFVREIKGLNKPTAIAITDKGEHWSYYKDEFLIVIDNFGGRIQKFDLHGLLLARVEAGLPPLPANCEFSDCAIDYYENIWITDKLNNCLHKFDRFLRFITKVLPPDGKKFTSPRGITIWKRYGQVFIVEREAIDYFWIGVDGYIEGCYPSIFNPKEKGVTIVLYLTEPAHISGKIYNENNKEIRDFVPLFKGEPREHNIIWDGRDNTGEIVKPGEYRIELTIEPTYSSKGYFKKKLEAKVVCEYENQEN